MIKASRQNTNPITLWDHAAGAVSLFLVFSLCFFPDEKLVRLKLQSLEIFLFLLILLAGLRIIFTGDRPLLNPKIFFLVVGFYGLVQGGLWFLSAEKSLANPEMRRILLGLGGFFSFALFPLKEKWRNYFLGFWAACAALLSVYGILQHFGGVGFVQVPQFNRIIGTFGNPIFFGAFLVSSFLLTSAILSTVKNDGLRFILFLFLILQLTALYYTKTRAAWISLAAVLGIFGILKGGVGKRPLWIWVSAILLLFVFVGKTQNTWKRDQGHLMIWRDTLSMFLDKPLTGVGLGAFHTNFPAYAREDLKSKWPKGKFIVNYAHNEYVQVLAETGLLGAIPFFAVLIIYVIFVFRWFKNLEAPLSWLSLAPIALLIQNLFSVDMRFNITFALFFILSGMAITGLSVNEKYEKIQNISGVLKVFIASVWAGFMGLVLFPHIMKPYLANKEFSSQVDFFDQRLLDPAKSIRELEELNKQYPREVKVLEKLAYFYAKEMKTSDNKINNDMAMKAVDAYQKLLVLDPANIGGHNNLANVYYTAGHVDDAISHWRKVLDIKPDFIDVHLNLGKILYVRGELKESAAHFQRVLEIDPRNAEAVVYLKKMVE